MSGKDTPENRVNVQFDVNAVKLADVSCDLTPLAEGLGKTAGALPRFIHRLCVLIFGDAYTDRICRDMKKQAQAEYDSEAIKNGTLRLFGDGTTVPAMPSPDTATPSRMARRHKEDIETGNLLACAAEAARVLEAMEASGSPLPPGLSQTFVNRWKNEAQFVSEKKLQNLWGAILAGEIAAPGSVSLKTLDILKTVSKEDAVAFASLCDQVLDGDCYLAPTVYAATPEGIQEKNCYSLDRLDALEELGFIHAPSPLALDKRRLIPENGTVWLDYGRFAFCLKSATEILLSMNLLKPAGKEICRIVRNVTQQKAENLARLMLTYDEFRDTGAIALYEKTGFSRPDGRSELVLKTVIDRNRTPEAAA